MTLAELIAHGPMPVTLAAEVLLSVCDALGVAHARRLVHGDIRPAKLVVWRLADGRYHASPVGFGAATRGTLGYASPEQLGGATLDGRSDIWSLGAVLFELVTGQRAFPGEDLDTVRVAMGRGPGWSLFRNRLPAGSTCAAEALIRRCLQMHPTSRISTVTEVKAQLIGIASSRATTPPPAHRPPTGPMPETRKSNYAPEPEAPATERDDDGEQTIVVSRPPMKMTCPLAPLQPRPGVGKSTMVMAPLVRPPPPPATESSSSVSSMSIVGGVVCDTPLVTKVLPKRTAILRVLLPIALVASMAGLKLARGGSLVATATAATAPPPAVSVMPSSRLAPLPPTEAGLLPTPKAVPGLVGSAATSAKPTPRLVPPARRAGATASR